MSGMISVANKANQGTTALHENKISSFVKPVQYLLVDFNYWSSNYLSCVTK